MRARYAQRRLDSSDPEWHTALPTNEVKALLDAPRVESVIVRHEDGTQREWVIEAEERWVPTGHTDTR